MAGIQARYELDARRRGLAATTIRNWHFQLLVFTAWIDTNSLTMSDVTTDDVQRFLDGRGLANRSRYCWVSMLHGFFSWAVVTGELAHDPTEAIMRPKFPLGIPRPISDDDLTMALDLARPNQRAALMLAAYAGLRCCEIAGLERSGVDERAMTLRVIGKGGHEGVIPMRPDVLDALAFMGMPSRGRVFRRANGQAYSAPQLSKWLNGYLHSIGITTTAHKLRHWAGTKVLKSSGNLRVAQEFLRHASITSTQGYTKIDAVEVTAAVRGMPMLAEPNEQRLPLAIAG